jgi:hypothetical protein
MCHIMILLHEFFVIKDESHKKFTIFFFFLNSIGFLLDMYVSVYSRSSGAKSWGSPLYPMKTAVTSACASKFSTFVE